jgi:hypothetical protein
VKQPISAKTEDELRQDFPLHDRLVGWFFRIDEVSAEAYVAEGSDRYGGRVSRQGSNPDELLEQCIADARSIEASISKYPPPNKGLQLTAYPADQLTSCGIMEPLAGRVGSPSSRRQLNP